MCTKQCRQNNSNLFNNQYKSLDVIHLNGKDKRHRSPLEVHPVECLKKRIIVAYFFWWKILENTKFPSIVLHCQSKYWLFRHQTKMLLSLLIYISIIMVSKISYSLFVLPFINTSYVCSSSFWPIHQKMFWLLLAEWLVNFFQKIS